MIVIMEPMISGSEADIVYKKFGKTHWCRLEVMGFSMGIWLLWDMDVVHVQLHFTDKSILHAVIS